MSGEQKDVETIREALYQLPPELRDPALAALDRFAAENGRLAVEAATADQDWKKALTALERAERELRQANSFRDQLARKLSLADTALVEIESALSCNPDYDPEHWRGHAESAAELLRRATKKQRREPTG